MLRVPGYIPAGVKSSGGRQRCIVAASSKPCSPQGCKVGIVLALEGPGLHLCVAAWKSVGHKAAESAPEPTEVLNSTPRVGCISANSSCLQVQFLF